MQRLCSIFFVAISALAASNCGPSTGARRARAHLAQGNAAAADEVATKTLQENPKDVEAWQVRIRAALTQGELERAAKLYEEQGAALGSPHHKTARMMAAATLYQGLQAGSAEVVASTVAIIERQEVESLAESVTELLGHDDDLIAAAAAVALLRSHPVAPEIAGELIGSSNPRARVIAVRGVARKIGSMARRDILERLADSDEDVRAEVASALARFGEAEDTRFLLALAKDVSKKVRGRALRGLVEVGGAEAVTIARVALTDDHLGTRHAAVNILVRHGTEADRERVRALISGDDLSLAIKAATALGAKDGATDLLERAIQSPTWVVRAAAINSCRALLEREDALRFAGRGMGDNRLEVRLAAARTLLQFGRLEPALRALQEALQSERFETRLVAAIDLGRRGDEQALEVLSRLAMRSAGSQRRSALLAHHSAGSFTPGLVSSLADTNIEIRLLAAEAILATASK